MDAFDRAFWNIIFRIQTLKHTNETLITTLDEVMKIQMDGREKRRAAEAELAEMENLVMKLNHRAAAAYNPVKPDIQKRFVLYKRPAAPESWKRIMNCWCMIFRLWKSCRKAVPKVLGSLPYAKSFLFL